MFRVRSILLFTNKLYYYVYIRYRHLHSLQPEHFRVPPRGIRIIDNNYCTTRALEWCEANPDLTPVSTHKGLCTTRASSRPELLISVHMHAHYIQGCTIPIYLKQIDKTILRESRCSVIFWYFLGNFIFHLKKYRDILKLTFFVFFLNTDYNRNPIKTTFNQNNLTTWLFLPPKL